MSLKYFDSRPKVAPKQSYIDDFEAMAELLYENAPNYYAIDDINYLEHEVTYGSKDFEPIEARIDSVIDPTTGKNVGDDYKNFILMPNADKVFIGKLFRWNDNYWIAVNTNTYESLTNACIVKRCTNMLKWIDSNGILQQEPCSIGYDIFQPGDYAAKEYLLVDGQIVLQCQKTLTTNKITPNMRFLIGTAENRRAFKVTGNGNRNFLNNKTDDDYSPSIIEFYMDANYPNAQTDDIANGIADAYINTYTLTINQDPISQSIGFTTTLTATIRKEGEVVAGTVLWTSSNTAICTVSSGGVVTFIANGTATITAKMSSNTAITDTLVMTVTATPVADYEIRMLPTDANVFEGTENTYVFKLYLNGVIQADTFTFAVVGTNVPDYCYLLTVVDGYSFKIKNLRMYTPSDLIISCTTTPLAQNFTFKLKGVF